MTKIEAVKHFGTQERLAEKLGMKQNSIASWGDIPPPIRQVQIERLTKGKLKADPACYGASR